MLLTGLLHLTGYDLSLDQVKRFRQWGASHPPPRARLTPGVEVTTGPLGQGFANGWGSPPPKPTGRPLQPPGHEIVNHYTYGIVSDAT